jgi:ferredoxin
LKESVRNTLVNLLVKYKIQIDRTLCIACGTCYSLNPTHFEPGREEKSSVIGGETDENSSSGTFDDEEIESAKEAEDSCPASAITIFET